MDEEFSKCTELMDKMLESPEELNELIPQFQEIFWNAAYSEEDKAWEVMGDLAYDLDFYEPDPRRRAQDYSFFDKDTALIEIRKAKDKLKKLTEQELGRILSDLQQ